MESRLIRDIRFGSDMPENVTLGVSGGKRAPGNTGNTGDLQTALLQGGFTDASAHTNYPHVASEAYSGVKTMFVNLRRLT